MSAIEQLRQAWAARTAQEQLYLSAGAAVVGLALIYSLLLEPALEGRRNLQRDLPNLRQEAAQMQALAAEAAALQKRPPLVSSVQTKDSLSASMAARSLQASSIVISGEFIKLEFKGAAFAGITAWLDQLRRENGVMVQEASFVPQGSAGQVDATLTLRQRMEASPQ